MLPCNSSSLLNYYLGEDGEFSNLTEMMQYNIDALPTFAASSAACMPELDSLRSIHSDHENCGNQAAVDEDDLKKKEKRRQQVRFASRRRRKKQKVRLMILSSQDNTLVG